MTDASTNGTYEAHTLVVGGGISGLTSALELAEVGKEVLLVEKDAVMGGRVARMNQYFPKLCPPSCGLEINFKRLKSSNRIKYFTLAEVRKVTGGPGDYTVEVKLSPRYVNNSCTACGDCEKVCEIEIDNDYNYGMDKRKAIFLPSDTAFPHLYQVAPEFAGDAKMKACVEACKYEAIDLDMKEETITLKVASIIWASGWQPYDAAKIENLGFGRVPNVITNVMMERLASVDGPTNGKILRPSDGKEVSSVLFAQCAGSRDENHLPYCSGVCCLASIKQAAYVRENYPEADIHVCYIDVRSPGRMEDFYTQVDADEKITFHRGKAAEVTEGTDGKVKVVAENTLTGDLQTYEVDLVVLATGMVPNTAIEAPAADVPLDENGFIVSVLDGGVYGAGTTVRPVDVASCVQDATGAAMKALQTAERS